MVRSRLRLVACIAIVASASTVACLSRTPPEKKLYVLTVDPAARTANLPPVASAGTSTAQEGRGAVLRVRRVRVSPLFDRKRFVYRTGEARFEDDFYTEFFATPGVLLRNAILDWMEPSPVFGRVLRAPGAEGADWTLEAQVHRFYVDARDSEAPRTVVEIEFTLIDARSTDLEVVLRRTYAAETEVAEPSGDAIVAGWSRSLSRLLSDLERDLHAVVSR